MCLKPGPHQQQCRSNVRLCCQKRQQCRTRFALKFRPFDKVERCFDIVASVDRDLVCLCGARVCYIWNEQDDIKEYIRKLKLQNHQVSQMKEELAFKEALLCKANLDQVNIEKEMEIIKVRTSYSCIRFWPVASLALKECGYHICGGKDSRCM